MQDTNHILIVLVTIFGVAVLLQVAVLAGLAITGMKALKMAKEYAEGMREYAEDMRTKIVPVLHSSQVVLDQSKALIARLEPKLDAAAGDLAEITRTAREETTRLSESAQEITERIRRQAERVDGMTTSALNGVDKVSHFLNEAVNAPVRQVNGIVAAARAIISTLRAPAPRRTPSDEEVAPKSRNYA